MLFSFSAQLFPLAERFVIGLLGKVLRRLRGEVQHLARAPARQRRGAGEAAEHLARGGRHVARLHRLPAGAVRQNTGEQARRLFRHLKGAVDEEQLRHDIHEAVFEEHQLGAGDDGQDNQQQLHGDDRAEHAERLHDKGGHPLLDFRASVQRLDGENRRRDDIQEQHVENARDTVEVDGHKVENQGKAREEYDDVVRGKADVEITADVVDVVNVLLAGIVWTAHGVHDVGVGVKGAVFRRSHGTHQEQVAIQRHAAPGRHGALVGLERAEGGIASDDLHRLEHRFCHRVIAHIQPEVIAQVVGVGDFLQHALPGVHDPAFLVCVGIVISEHILALQRVQVGANLVVAGIDVVLAGIGGVEGIVADGVEHPPHCRELLLGIDDGFREIEVLRVVEDVVDLLHERVGGAQHHDHDGAHAQNQEDGLQQRRNRLPQGLLHLAAGVEHLAHHRRDGKAEGQHDTDDRHAPIHVADGVVAEKDVDEIVLLAVVRDLGDTGKDLKHLVEHADNPAQSGFHVVQESAEKAFQHQLHDAENDIKQALE